MRRGVLMPAPNIPQMIASAAMANGIDPSLAIEVGVTESGLNQNARGAAGEIGVMQLMPATAAGLGVDPTDLQQNIDGGVALLAHLISQYGDTAKALAAYNDGPSGVDRAISQGGSNWFSFIPSSTRAYVSKILAAVSSAYTATAAPDVQAMASGALDMALNTADGVDQLATAAGAVNWGSPLTIALLIGAGLIGLLVVRDVLAEA